LALLPDSNYLRLFVGGLTHLIRDEFADAVRLLEEGISFNEENLPLNRDMALIIEQVSRLDPADATVSGDETISATSLLLGQFNPRRTTH